MSDPLWHHYVPRMYLKVWCDPNDKDRVLWVYEESRKPKRKGPKAVAAESGFYFGAELVGDENLMEKAFALMETIAAPHLQKLRDGTIKLTNTERSEFATFMGVTKMRTRFSRELMASTAIEILKQGFEKTVREGGVAEMVSEIEAKSGEPLGPTVAEVEAIMTEIAEGKVALEQKSNLWSSMEAMKRGEELGLVIEKASWGLLEAPTGSSFITSDNPILMADPIAKAAGPKKFTFTEALQVLYPISPRYLLMADFRNKGDGQHLLSPEKVQHFNDQILAQAHEQVYASFGSDVLQQAMDKVFKERAPVIQKPPPGLL